MFEDIKIETFNYNSVSDMSSMSSECKYEKEVNDELNSLKKETEGFGETINK